MIRVRVFLAVIISMCSLLSATAAKSNFQQSDIFDSVTANDKVALLMVHFGTSHADTRAKTIEAMNELAHERYPDLEVREAWTSRIIIRIMKGRGEEIPTPLDALQQLKADGYTHIVIQSSNIIEGIEMESLRRDVEAIRDEFKDIRIGNPLLYHTADYESVLKCVEQRRPKNSALVMVGHGTYTPTTAQYAMVDYVREELGYNKLYIGTIEGYPTFETMMRRIEQGGEKRLTLMPFMFVCGEHAKNDIADDWQEELTNRGYKVDVIMEGLGEQAAIQELFIDHIEFAMKNQMYDIMVKKSEYLRGER